MGVLPPPSALLGSPQVRTETFTRERGAGPPMGRLHFTSCRPSILPTLRSEGARRAPAREKLPRELRGALAGHTGRPGPGGESTGELPRGQSRPANMRPLGSVPAFAPLNVCPVNP